MPYFEFDNRRYHYLEWGAQGLKMPYVLLHGFAQSAHTWDGVAELLAEDYQVIALDLIGHGQSDRPVDPHAYSLASQAAALDALLNHCGFSQVVLVGYSMGGRLAATYAVDYPARIERLILESAGLGPQDEAEREAMRDRDKALVERLHTNTLEDFFDYWESLPLFETQRSLPAEVRERIRNERLQNDTESLALTVQESGQHAMSDLLNRLSNMRFPIQYIAGAQDEKYAAIAKQLEGVVAKTTILNAGHNTHLESPEEFIQQLKPIS